MRLLLTSAKNTPVSLFPVWLEDEGASISPATGKLISWSGFLSRSAVPSLGPAIRTKRGQVWRSIGGTEMRGTARGDNRSDTYSTCTHCYFSKIIPTCGSNLWQTTCIKYLALHCNTVFKLSVRIFSAQATRTSLLKQFTAVSCLDLL